MIKETVIVVISLSKEQIPHFGWYLQTANIEVIYALGLVAWNHNTQGQIQIAYLVKGGLLQRPDHL